MSEELIECPFCKHDALIVTDIHPRHDTEVYYGECTFCGAESEVCNSKEEAIKAWNTRPSEDALKAEMTRLKDAIQKIVDLRMLNPNLKESAYPYSCSEDMFINFYCKMGDIAVKALTNETNALTKMKEKSEFITFRGEVFEKIYKKHPFPCPFCYFFDSSDQTCSAPCGKFDGCTLRHFYWIKVESKENGYKDDKL